MLKEKTLIVLSLRENQEIAKEADFLCDLIRSHEKKLREAHWGRKVSIHGVSFKLYQKDRNTIYRIQAVAPEDRGRMSLDRRNLIQLRSKGRTSNWFLKMPRQKRPKMIEREIIGAEIVRQALRNHENYYHTNAIRASANDAYILYSEIPGKPLHLAFYRECFAFVPNGIKRYAAPSTLLNKTFRNFGDVMARFHVYRNQNKDGQSETTLPENGIQSGNNIVFPSRLPQVKKHPANGLSEIIDKLSGSDAISRAILKWVEEQKINSNDKSIVHGNLKLDNVIVHDGKICLIDFENCGWGPIYHDLSWICCLILLTRALPLFPWRHARLALTSFINGYKNVSDYDCEILFQFITMRLCDFYIGTYYSGHIRAKIAGIPVSRRRFQKLISAMIEGKFDGVLDGINF